MQLLELSVGSIRVRHANGILHIRVGHSRISRARASHYGISIRPLIHGMSSIDTLSSSKSNIGANFLFTIGTSGEGGALVFDDFLKYVIEDSFGIVRVTDL